MFDIYEKLAIEKSGLTYLTNIRKKRRKLQFDEGCEEDTNFDSRESLKVNTVFVILGKLDAELEKRKKFYENIKEKYSFLLNFTKLSLSELDLCANELCKTYKNDLDESFSNECQHFHNYLLSKQHIPRTVLEISMFLKENNTSDLFPYIDIVSRMFLCLPASNCSAERSFSTLKRIKNNLRSRLTEDHLNSLSILNIENDICRNIDYEDIINEFANNKSRRNNF